MSEDDAMEHEYSAGRFPPVYLPPVKIVLGQREHQMLPPFHLANPRHFPGVAMYQQQQPQPATASMEVDPSRSASTGGGGGGGMSLNVHLAVPPAAVGGNGGNNEGSHTPNTPEILNSIVSMSMQQQSAPFGPQGPFAAASTAGQGAVQDSQQQHLQTVNSGLPEMATHQVGTTLTV